MVEKRRQSRTTDSEYQEFAEDFVDMILDSRKPWVFQHLIDGGFQTVPSWEDLNSGKFALEVLHTRREGGRLWEPWLFDALVNANRPLLIPYFKKHAQDKRLPKDALTRLLEIGKSSTLRKSFKALAKPFSSHRGPKPKLPTEKNAEARETAELLQPAILKLLEIPSTSHTLVETLQFLHKDYPKACEFLLRHVHLLQQALKDPKLLRRAAKRIEARSRVLADAMAGADYELSFSTSLERVRQARRLLPQNSL
jgi:hypothetical protein